MSTLTSWNESTSRSSLSPYTEVPLSPFTKLAMSIPECVRYRNSTMFVGQPPFGYESTDDLTYDATSHWHPPRTSPHDMLYRELGRQVPGLRPPTRNRSRSLARSRSRNLDAAPNVKLNDVVPALLSSPNMSSGLRLTYHLFNCRDSCNAALTELSTDIGIVMRWGRIT